MSKKKIDTTWTVYSKALRDCGLNPKDYEDMKEILDSRENEFYVRQYLPLNEKIISGVLEDAKTTASQIKEFKNKDKKDFDRNLTRDCSWCEYYTLCQAELRGLDTDFIRKADYQKKQELEVEDEDV